MPLAEIFIPVVSGPNGGLFATNTGASTPIDWSRATSLSGRAEYGKFLRAPAEPVAGPMIVVIALL